MTMALALMASSQLFAQNDAPKMSAEDHVSMLDEKLSLTADQKTKLTTLFTDFDKMRSEQKRQSKEEMDAFEASVLAVLTTEQQATYKQMQSERKEPPANGNMKGGKPADRKGGPQGGGPAPKDMSAQRIKQLDEKLSLTADQKAKIQALYDAFDKQMEAERNSGSKPDPEAMKTNMDKLDSDIAALLTSDQQTAYKQFLQDEAANRPQGRPGKPDKQPKGKK